MTVYVVGHNMVGYMPESEPWATESFADAKASLVEDITRCVEYLMDCDVPDSRLGDYADVLLVLDSMDAPQEFGCILGYESYWIAIGTDQDLVNVDW